MPLPASNDPLTTTAPSQTPSRAPSQTTDADPCLGTRVFLFTDTLGDVNGVSRFIRSAAARALAIGRDFTVVTSTRFELPDQSNIINFDPLLAGKMPRYENLEIVLPPLVKMLRFAKYHQPDAIHVSTPGPVGAVGLLASRMLRVPVVGVYHTDFPAYVQRLFDDEALAWACERVMAAFYRPFTTIFARSEDYRSVLASLGIEKQRIQALRPGICLGEFHPRFRDHTIWPRLTGEGGPCVRLLFVGRVSIEKNLAFLARVWHRADERLKRKGLAAQLIIVGDGPYREEMQRELTGTNTRFLGFRQGPDLSAIYASSDIFVFPSTTDTLGQVVMESQAAGLPVLVSDRGGPKEIVLDGKTGFVLSADRTNDWIARIVELVENEPRRHAMGIAAHQFLQPFSIEKSFDHFWSVHEAAHRDASDPRPGILIGG